MKLVKQLLLAIVFTAGALVSCVEDKGNYDYDWIPNIGIKFEKESLTISRLSVLKVNPIFINTDNDTPIEVNYDDYEYLWEYVPQNTANYSNVVRVSDKYNIDETILLPVGEEQTMRLKATNKKDGRILLAEFKISIIETFKRAYLFLTEDQAGDIDLEFYGWDSEDNVTHNNMPGYLAGTGFPFTTGGAKAIAHDARLRRIYIASGSGMGWLDTPSFDFLENNLLETILVPKRTETFENIIRLGGTAKTLSSCEFYCFTETGELNIYNNSGFIPSKNFMTETMKSVKLAPMLGAYKHQKCGLLWDETNKKILWANFEYTGMAINSNKFLNPLSYDISKELSEAICMGGSADETRALTAVVKAVDKKYWRLDYEMLQKNPPFDPHIPNAIKAPKELVGTGSLVDPNHWYISAEKGYLYTVVNKKELYVYIESQAGGVTDPGWTQTTITDAEDNPVTIEDPVSFIWAENNGSGELQTSFYVATYSTEKGGTVYMLNPSEVGSELKLVDKFSGLGNIKKMCYWWP